MDGASVVWVALMVFLYVEPSLGSRQLPKRATSPPSWLMQSTIVGKTRRRSLCYFSGLLCYFFASVRARTFSLNCAVKIGININTLYISWRGGQTSLFNGISCCFNENFKIMLLCYFFLKLFVLAILHSFFPTMQPTSSTDIFLSSTSSNGMNLTHGWIIMHKFVFSISKHGGGHCTDGRRSHYHWARVGLFIFVFGLKSFFLKLKSEGSQDFKTLC